MSVSDIDSIPRSGCSVIIPGSSAASLFPSEWLWPGQCLAVFFIAVIEEFRWSPRTLASGALMFGSLV